MNHPTKGFQLAAPVFWPRDSGAETTIFVAGERSQVEMLVHLGRKHGGIEWVAGKWREQKSLVVEPLQKLHVRGRQLRRAVAKIALNVLAHREPALARHVSLAGTKKAIRSGRGDVPVWWELDAREANLHPQVHPLGHRVILIGDAAAKRMQARVGFFGVLCFAVDLGSLPVAVDFTEVVDIDPLAERPDDLHIHRYQGVLAELAPERLMSAWEVEMKFMTIQQHIGLWNWEHRADTKALVRDLNALRASVPAAARPAALEARLFDVEDQRVLHLAVKGARLASFWYPGSGEQASARLMSLIRAKRFAPSNLHRITMRTLNAVRCALASAISDALVARPLRSLDVLAYFDGPAGYDRAIRAMAPIAGLETPKCSLEEAQARMLTWAQLSGSAVDRHP